MHIHGHAAGAPSIAALTASAATPTARRFGSGFLSGSLVAIALLACGCEKGQNNPVPPVVRPESTAGQATREVAVTPPIPAGTEDLFEDVTGRAGLQFVHQFCDVRIANIIESNGAGLAVLDYDADGFADLYLINSGPLAGVTHEPAGTTRQPNRLYRNRRDGTFEDVTEKAGVGGAGYGTAAAAADYDNDGFTDLYVVNIGKSILYRNRGNGTFEDVTEQAGLTHTGTGIGAVFVDVDNDGKLDLFVANYLTFDPKLQEAFNPDAYPGPLSYKPEFNVLYRNKGDGSFEDISEAAGIRIPNHRAMSVCAVDFDKNGTQDIYVSNDGTPNLMLVNDGKGHFTEQGQALWVAFNALGEAAGSMTAAVGDCNGDLLPDLLVSRLGYGSLYLGTTNRSFSDAMLASGLQQLTARYVGWGNNFLDFDNDGDLDIFVANGDAHRLAGWESLLLENNGAAQFTDAAAKGGAYFRSKVRARGSAIVDYDNDGRLDIVVTAMGDRPFLLRNRGSADNHWCMLDLQGTRSNRDGFGARIAVSAGGKSLYAEARCPAGFLGQSDRRVHFGLGPNKVLEQIEIRWPSGTIQRLENVPADRILKVKEI